MAAEHPRRPSPGLLERRGWGEAPWISKRGVTTLFMSFATPFSTTTNAPLAFLSCDIYFTNPFSDQASKVLSLAPLRGRGFTRPAAREAGLKEMRGAGRSPLGVGSLAGGGNGGVSRARGPRLKGAGARDHLCPERGVFPGAVGAREPGRACGKRGAGPVPASGRSGRPCCFHHARPGRPAPNPAPRRLPGPAPSPALGGFLAPPPDVLGLARVPSRVPFPRVPGPARAAPSSCRARSRGAGF